MKKEENISSVTTMIEEKEEQHLPSQNLNTPMRADAFQMSEADKIDAIAERFSEIMDILGLDLADDSLKGTPYRVEKMYVKEIFYGLDPDQKPKMSVFDNTYQYGKFILEDRKSTRLNSSHV